MLTIADLDVVAELYDGVVVKLSKAGGIASAFALISACAERGLRVLLGCMVESSLGIAAGLQLAGLADHVDLDGALLLAEDPFTGISVEGDLLTASNRAGAGGAAGGVKPRPRALRAARRRRGAQAFASAA